MTLPVWQGRMQETRRTQVYEAEYDKLWIPLLPACTYCYRSCDQWLLQKECKQKRMIKGGTEAPVLVIRPKPGTAAFPRGDNCTGNFCDIGTTSHYSQLNHVTSKQLQAIWDVCSNVCYPDRQWSWLRLTSLSVESKVFNRKMYFSYHTNGKMRF